MVVMNGDASAGLDVDVTGATTVPALRPTGIGLLVGGVVALLAGGLLVGLAVAAAPPRRP
jgi:hypothetical protein